MLYRTMLDNENMDLQDTHNIPNEYETESKQQTQTEPPYIGYPMMDEMYDPSTYEYQMTEEDNENMERAPKHNDSYHQGYNQGYNHGFQHGFQHGHNNRNFPFFPFIFPFLFFRD